MYLFLHGAEMQPERVRAAWPEARFVARGRFQPRPLGALSPPVGAQYETWGIIVEAPDGSMTGEERGVLTDDGRTITAIAPPPDDADPAAVLAAARYWELSPPYVRRLAQLATLPVQEETGG